MPKVQKKVSKYVIQKDAALLKEWLYNQPYSKVIMIRHNLITTLGVSRRTFDGWIGARNPIKPLYKRLINDFAQETIFNN